MNFPKRLQTLRKSKGLSQPELAKIIEVSDRSISAWERGLTLPNTEIAIKLADFFDVSIDYLLARDKKLHNTQLDSNIISIQRAYEKLTPTDKEKMIQMNKLMFEAAFNKGEDDIEDTI